MRIAVLELVFADMRTHADTKRAEVGALSGAETQVMVRALRPAAQVSRHKSRNIMPSRWGRSREDQCCLPADSEAGVGVRGRMPN